MWQTIHYEVLFCHEIWSVTDSKALKWYNESTVYATGHALLQTRRIGREVALLECMECMKGLGGGVNFSCKIIRKGVLGALGSLLAQVQEGKPVVLLAQTQKGKPADGHLNRRKICPLV